MNEQRYPRRFKPKGTNAQFITVDKPGGPLIATDWNGDIHQWIGNGTESDADEWLANSYYWKDCETFDHWPTIDLSTIDGSGCFHVAPAPLPAEIPAVANALAAIDEAPLAFTDADFDEIERVAATTPIPPAEIPAVEGAPFKVGQWVRCKTGETGEVLSVGRDIIRGVPQPWFLNVETTISEYWPAAECTLLPEALPPAEAVVEEVRSPFGIDYVEVLSHALRRVKADRDTLARRLAEVERRAEMAERKLVEINKIAVQE